MKSDLTMQLSLFILIGILVLIQAEESDYIPAPAEEKVLATENQHSNSGCVIWEPSSPLRPELMLWKTELTKFNGRRNMKTDFSPDIRREFKEDYSNREEVCSLYADPPRPTVPVNTPPKPVNDLKDPRTVEMKQSLRTRRLDDPQSKSEPNLMTELFSESKQLSYLPRQGYMEPLLPPLRHPFMCEAVSPELAGAPGAGSLDYLIEDFGHLCRHAIKKSSRTVFIDIGATYNFNTDQIDKSSPAINVIEKYRRFGIHFDHIYAYELIKWDTERVYKTIPDHMHGPLHWINTGVTGEVDHPHNPFTMLLSNFGPDDFVVVKLDIDTPSVEMPLFHQLLNDTQLHEIVDVFYFEHHVKMDEMQQWWGTHDSGRTEGTIFESLTLFNRLRRAGVAAHYWI